VKTKTKVGIAGILIALGLMMVSIIPISANSGHLDIVSVSAPNSAILGSQVVVSVTIKNITSTRTTCEMATDFQWQSGNYLMQLDKMDVVLANGQATWRQVVNIPSSYPSGNITGKVYVFHREGNNWIIDDETSFSILALADSGSGGGG
jgi:hypothetical protein